MCTEASQFLAGGNELAQLTFFNFRGFISARDGYGPVDFSTVANAFTDVQRTLLECRVRDLIEDRWPRANVQFEDDETWDSIRGTYDVHVIPHTFRDSTGRVEFLLGDTFRVLEQDETFQFVRSGGIQDPVKATLQEFSYDTPGVRRL